MEGLVDDSNALMLPSCRKKRKRKSCDEGQEPPLSGLHKTGKLSRSQQRKIRRIQEEEEKKRRRCQVLDALQKHSLADSAYTLLYSSGSLGQVATVKEKLRRALQFKRAGLKVPSDVPLFHARNSKQTMNLREDNFQSMIVAQVDSEIQRDTTDRAATLVKEESVLNDVIDATSQVNRIQQAERWPSLVKEGGAANGIVSATPQVNIIREAEQRASMLKCQSVVDVDVTRCGDVNHSTSVLASNHCHEKLFVEIPRSEEVEKSRNKLPILMMEQEIMEAINDNGVVIICGETGCGKTTQVPQFLYEAGFGSSRCQHRSGMIGVTQPRRVAVLSTARRIAHEMNLNLGHEIGFQVRHDRFIGDNCCIKFMTDGILLREVQADFLLRKYSVIILDEAHERSLNTDILIGMLSRILPLRQELFHEHCKAVEAGKVENSSFISTLKLIVMSATLHLEDFVSNRKMFPIPPPIVEVPTRQFPVTIHFAAKTELVDYVNKAYKKVCAIHKKLPAGGILVFLTGHKEVHFLCQKLVKTFCKACATSVSAGNQNAFIKIGIQCDKGRHGLNVGKIVQPVDCCDPQSHVRGRLGYIDDDMSGVEEDDDDDDGDDNILSITSDAGIDKNVVDPGPVCVLPLYAMLPAAAQLRVFDPVPEGTRLVVVATNVAETSITIPGIKYVVDCGRAKEKEYNISNGVAKYQVSWISKASAAQRAGRAGRTGPGHCYRLYSSAVFNDMFSDFCVPEINRVPIEGLVLLMKCMGINKVINFPFPSQPDKSSLVEAEKCLVALSALDSKSHLPTKLGKAMAAYPISPRHSRMLVSLIWSHFGYHVTADAALVFAYATAVAAGLSLDLPLLREGFLEKNPKALRESVEPIARMNLTNRNGRQSVVGAYLKFQSVSSDALSIATALRAYEVAENQDEFCESNFLHAKTMCEMSKLRQQLIRLFLLHMSDSSLIDEECDKPVWKLDHASIIESVWSKTDQNLTQEQEERLRQAICAGWADRVAKKLSLDECMKLQEGGKCRDAVRYQSSAVEETVFLHPSSSLSKVAPEFVVYNELICTSKLYMRSVTSVEPKWFASQASGLCIFSAPLIEPAPWYDTSSDNVMCWVSASFGPQRWQLPLQCISMRCGKNRTSVFACALLQGKVLSTLACLRPYLAADPCIILKPEGRAYKRASDLLQALGTGHSAVDTRKKLKAMWDIEPQYLFHEILSWLQKKHRGCLGNIWTQAKDEILLYEEKQS